MHEYGHYIDSQMFGWYYLPVLGIPSLISAAGDGDHSRFWSEIRANKNAKEYFRWDGFVDWNSAHPNGSGWYDDEWIFHPYTIEDRYPTK